MARIFLIVKRLQVAYTHAHAKESFMVYFKQGKMSDMEKSYSFHSVIIPVNHVVTNEWKLYHKEANDSSMCYIYLTWT